MRFRINLAAVAAIAFASCTIAIAQEPLAPELDLHDLPDEHFQKGLTADHPIGLPSATELLYILAKEGSPQWRKLYHPIPKSHPTDRAKAARRRSGDRARRRRRRRPRRAPARPSAS